MKQHWHTAWLASDIAVYCDETEIDRLPAVGIRRVVFVYRGLGDSPGDLLYALVETDAEVLTLAAETGFAGRVNFERLGFWAERDCVFWVPERAASLPLRLRRGGGWLGLGRPPFKRTARAEFEGVLAAWPLEGPQTWDERKWLRIQRKRPFAAADMPLRVRG